MDFRLFMTNSSFTISNADNCLRAFKRSAGQKFCSSFTTKVVTGTDDLPAFVTQCTGNTVSRMSSACSCLDPACSSAASTSQFN